jgi:hypothetical protein
VSDDPVILIFFYIVSEKNGAIPSLTNFDIHEILVPSPKEKETKKAPAAWYT